MKHYLSIFLLFVIHSQGQAQFTISGIVQDEFNGPLIGATVQIIDRNIPITGTTTDMDGKYTFKIKEKGVFQIKVTYIGYLSQEKELVLKNKEHIQLDFELSGSHTLDEVVVVEYKAPIIEKDMTSSSSVLEGKATGVTIASSGTRTAKKESRKSTKPAPPKIIIRGFASPSKTMEATETEVSYAAETYEEVITDANLSARQLTVAEWNDLNNWDAWKKFMKDPELDRMQDHWQFFPDQRFSIYMSNHYDLPVADAKVVLKNMEKVVWESRTDNSGKAELWGNLYAAADKNFTMEVIYNNKNYEVKHPELFEEKINKFQLPIECEKINQADIMFVVDATGSMGDEIEYLKAELKDVIQNVEATNSNLDLRLGSVFYRDQGDAYVSRTSPLSANIKETLAFNSKQGAGGGGDFPEAVHIGLEKALEQDWSEEAIARIIFLVLDAPPHHNEKVMESLRTSVKKAAALGIKIIPISGSGINRHTEFLLKFMAMSTNGTYLFLTDDSGIGNAHLDPIVKDYEVEYLNEAMLRLIYYYTRFNGCENQQYTLTEKDKTYNTKWGNAITLYPNPADQYANIKSKKSITKISIHDAGGRLVEVIEHRKDKAKIEVDHLPDGMYTVKVFGEKEFTTKQLLVMH